MPFGVGIIGWVAEHGQYVLASDVRREPRYRPAKMEATLSELAVPVRLLGEVVAVINVESDRLDAFDEGDVVAVDGIAAQVASAIRNARLFEEKVRALRNLEILQEITNVLNSDLDLDALIGRIARRSVEAVRPAQMGAVLLFHEDTLVVRSSYGYERPEALAAVRLGFHEGLPGSVFVSGQGRLVRCGPEDYAGHRETFTAAAGGRSRESALCVPISLPQEKLGVLLLESATAPDAFDAGGPQLRDRRSRTRPRSRSATRCACAHRGDGPAAPGLPLEREPRAALAADRDPGIRRGAGRRGPEPAAAEQFVRVALEHCERLGRMVDEVLELARLEKGVAQRPIDWSPVVRLATAARGAAAAARRGRGQGRAFTEQVEDVPALPGDERLLHLLLHHLVENAVKFTPQGRPRRGGAPRGGGRRVPPRARRRHRNRPSSTTTGSSTSSSRWTRAAAAPTPARVSASTSRARWSTSTRAPSASRARPARARPSRCVCPSGRSAEGSGGARSRVRLRPRSPPGAHGRRRAAAVRE